MTRHYDFELQEALDGRLGAAARAEIEAHVGACPSCRAAYERLRWVKEALDTARDPEELPPRLDTRIRAALDEEDRAARSPRAAALRRWQAVALAAGIALVVGAGLLTLRRPAAPLPATAVADDFHRYRSGALQLAAATEDAARLQAFFAAKGVGFDVRVLDLRMMGYRLVGGGMGRVDDRPSALIVYRADSGRIVLCVMYAGDAAVAAPGGEVRDHAGLAFYVHRQHGTATVFWQEGAVTCALVSDDEPEQVIRLAFEKAMRAT